MNARIERDIMQGCYTLGLHCSTCMPVFVLDDFRSAFNVGSAFRTAEAIAPCAVFPCGVSARPFHRRLAHTARGTQDLVPWRYFPRALDAVSWLRATGRRIVVVESPGGPDCATIWEARFANGDAFVFGNEAEGVAPEVFEAADLSLRFPQSGVRSCINVASMIAMVAAELRRRRLVGSLRQ
ncbi:hypothetical protein JW921_03090 [Candidatus Fermentibacterales bacterium]|nr:hypothetical protein [Candidatus Fermentibacterales bacterium]